MGRQRADHGGGEQASKSVGVGCVERPGSPEEIANVHEESVEFVDERPRVGHRRSGGSWMAGILLRGKRGRHGGFERELVGCEEGSEGREGAGCGGEEGQEVDSQGVRGKNANMGVMGSVGDYVGEGREVGKNGELAGNRRGGRKDFESEERCVSGESVECVEGRRGFGKEAEGPSPEDGGIETEEGYDGILGVVENAVFEGLEEGGVEF